MMASLALMNGGSFRHQLKLIRSATRPMSRTSESVVCSLWMVTAIVGRKPTPAGNDSGGADAEAEQQAGMVT
jgi:hypothetical protein